jgi:hypothetical protein
MLPTLLWREPKIVWNGRNSNEQRVASGLYFCKMETKEKSVTKKMILMK